MRVLSICSGMGLMDRAFLDSGCDVVCGCEIDPDQRLLHRQLCGSEPLAWDLRDLPALLSGQRFDGIIGGPPCQVLSKLRAMRAPKFPDLTGAVAAVLDTVRPAWFLFENVSPLALAGARAVKLDAMNFARPHQSRPRWFTHSPHLEAPAPLFPGSVDELMAYPIVAGRIYGPKRGAILQGYPSASDLKAPCPVIQKGLANAVHYSLARAWADSILGA